MQTLNRALVRKTPSTVWSQGKRRPIVVSIEPTATGSLMGFRLLGTRRTFYLSVASAFNYAVSNHTAALERRARQIANTSGTSLRSARSLAEKEYAGL
jgi:hypothetical protein